MKLDSTDRAILKVLLQDGRASLREIARKTSLTTPTVASHFSRLVESGFIKKFAPILDQSTLRQGVNAFVNLRINSGDTNSILRKLSTMSEVIGVFVTTGENNVVLKINCEDTKRLQDFLDERLPKLGGEVVSSQLILDAVKDEQPASLTGEIAVKLRCDYCKGEVLSDRPYNIRVGSQYHYFCCRTCRRSFLEKYGKRIARINAVGETA